MPSQEDYYNIDWVYSAESNVCVARNKEWLKNFTPIASQFISQGQRVPILGIGDVELEVRKVVGGAARWRERRGPRTTILVLRDVLYCPHFEYNIVGSANLTNRVLIMVDHELALADRDSGEVLCFLDNSLSRGLTKLWLKGQARGQSSLDPDVRDDITANMDAEQHRKLSALKKRLGSRVETADSNSTPAQVQPTSLAEQPRPGSKLVHLSQKRSLDPDDASAGPSKRRAHAQDSECTSSQQVQSLPTPPEYTREEREWLSVEHGGESGFHIHYGYDYDRESDRRVCRRIARALMKRQQHDAVVLRRGETPFNYFSWRMSNPKPSDLSPTPPRAGSGEENDKRAVAQRFEYDIADEQLEQEDEPTAHVADWAFNEKQLDFIKRAYGNSGTFTTSHSLKIHDDRDAKEAASLLEQLERSRGYL